MGSKRACVSADRDNATGLPASGRPGPGFLTRSLGGELAGRFIHKL